MKGKVAMTQEDVRDLELLKKPKPWMVGLREQHLFRELEEEQSIPSQPDGHCYSHHWERSRQSALPGIELENPDQPWYC